jgi:hypothetical protein
MSVASRWTADDAAGFGREVFEATPAEERARWAADLLDLCSVVCPPVAVVERVVAIGRKPHRWDWYDAGEAFRAIRTSTVDQERWWRPDRRTSALLYVAENAAKVIANAGGAAFDADAGWWMAPLVRTLVLVAEDAALEERVWARLVRARCSS